jgi:hypothetical protein
MGNTYNTTMSPELQAAENSTRENFGGVTGEAPEIEDVSQAASADQDTTSGLSFASALNVIKLFQNFIGWANKLFQTFANAIGIPSYMITGALAAATITYVIILVSSVFGKDP